MDAVYDIFDLPRGEAPDRRQTLACYAADSREALTEARSRAIAELGSFSLDAELLTAKGNRRWMRLTASAEGENGVAIRIFGIKQDITEEKILADRTRFLAEFDAMTGLANRSRFEARLSDSGRRRGDRASLGALMLVDLDGFKQVNDTYGHAAGDECLKEAASRLQAVCAEADLVARVGGDEFAILLGAHLDARANERLAAAVVEALSRPVRRGGRSFALGASVGVARADACARSDLFANADLALYAAKAGGRNTYRMFAPGMAQIALGRGASRFGQSRVAG